MLQSVELQAISRILHTENAEERNELMMYDDSYYSIYRPIIQYIKKFEDEYSQVPSVFEVLDHFSETFPNLELYNTSDPLAYIVKKLKDNKARNILTEMFNKLKDLDETDVNEAWKYISAKSEQVNEMITATPIDLIADAPLRAQMIIDSNKQIRIPTGFAELDKLLGGGLSTYEEFVLLIARTGNGKTFMQSMFAESAQRNGFPTLIYSPEMSSPTIGTRFDAFRGKGKFQNRDLTRGNYTEEYKQYLAALSTETTPVIVLEDKDVEGGEVTVEALGRLVKKHKIKLLIIDGLSYMTNSKGKPSDPDYIKFKALSQDLFKLGKRYKCAVVISMQANRETGSQKDRDGNIPIPSLFNVEGSDVPGRVCTQAWALRNRFEQGVIDLQILKSRTAQHKNEIYTYSADYGRGIVEYIATSLPGDALATSETTPVIDDSARVDAVETQKILSNGTAMPTVSAPWSGNDLSVDDTDDEVIEF